MTKAGNRVNTHQYWPCAATICEVDIVPDMRNTETRDSPIASS